MKRFTNLEIILMTIIFVGLIVVTTSLFNKKDNFENNNTMCNAHGYPNKNNQNILYKFIDEKHNRIRTMSRNQTTPSSENGE